MSLTIEKQIPIPQDYKRGCKKAQFVRSLKKGDSIMLSPEKPGQRASWRMAFTRQGLNSVTRKEGKGFRIWHNGKKKGDK